MRLIWTVINLGCATAVCYRQERHLATAEDHVEYAYTYNPFNHTDNQHLHMNIYQRTWLGLATDGLRPAFMMMHGGAYEQGTTMANDQEYMDFARTVAKHGWVTFNIEYRLLKGTTVDAADTHYDHGGDVNAFQAWAAIEDGRAALRYIQHRATDLHIDESKIGVAGESAGAQAVSWMAWRTDAISTHEGRSGMATAAGAPGTTTTYNTFSPDLGGTKHASQPGFHIKAVLGTSPEMSWWGASPSEIGSDHTMSVPNMNLIGGSADTVVQVHFTYAMYVAADGKAAKRWLTYVINGGHIPVYTYIYSRELGQCFTLDEWLAVNGGQMTLARATLYNLVDMFEELWWNDVRGCGCQGSCTSCSHSPSPVDSSKEMTYWEHALEGLIDTFDLTDTCGAGGDAEPTGGGKRSLKHEPEDIFV